MMRKTTIRSTVTLNGRFFYYWFFYAFMAGGG